MRQIENENYPIGEAVIAALGYASLNKRAVFFKQTATSYRLIHTEVLYSYKSLQTITGIQTNAKV